MRKILFLASLIILSASTYGQRANVQQLGLKSHFLEMLTPQSGIPLKAAGAAKMKLDSVVSKNYTNAYLYNKNGQVSVYTYTEHQSGGYFGQTQYRYSYDSAGRLTLASEYYRSSGDGDWFPNSQTKYEYQNNNLIRATESYPNGDDYYKYEYGYTGNLQTSETDYKMSGEWMLDNRTEITYDNNGLRVKETHYSDYNTDSAQSYIEYSYNASGYLTGIMVYVINGDAWVATEKYEFTYDSNHNMVGYYAANTYNTGDWGDSVTGEFAYDCSYPASGLIMPVGIPDNSYSELFILDMTGYSCMPTGARETGGTYQTTFYYSAASIGIEEAGLTGCGVYPNPATDIVNIALPEGAASAQFELYNAQGQKVMAKEVIGAQQIFIGALPAGVYLFSIQTAGNKQAGKLVKQ